MIMILMSMIRQLAQTGCVNLIVMMQVLATSMRLSEQIPYTIC